MAGNAHRWRHRKKGGKHCPPDCIYCKSRPKEGNYRNSNGHRKNPTRKKKGRRHPARNV